MPRRMLFGKRKREPSHENGIAYIPRAAQLYGDGPDPVAPSVDDPHPGTQTLYGNPGAPTVGRDFPTMQQIAEAGKRADPHAPAGDAIEWYAKRDVDAAKRNSETIVTPVNIPFLTPLIRRVMDRPIAPPSLRWTTQAHPNLYSFTDTREQIAGTPRELNGAHFSMADHRRDYPILGMRPPTARRNTFRLEPTAWDVDVVDRPADGDYTPQATYEAPPTPSDALFGSGRAYRAGG